MRRLLKKEFLGLISFLLMISIIGCGGGQDHTSGPDTPPDNVDGLIGKIIEAASLEHEDVQAAIEQAEDGDTVLLPPGSTIWRATVNIDKGITLQGAGIDKTIITPLVNETRSNYTISIRGNIGKPFRISGFTFKGNAFLTIVGDALGWRIDHCAFIDSNPNPDIFGKIYTNGYTRV
jgi:hypothetical protein